MEALDPQLAILTIRSNCSVFSKSSKKSGCIIPCIELLSTVAIKNLKDLKLDLPYPILLYGESTIDDVRKMIQSAQQSKGQEPGATGGNGTKRIGIYVKTGPIIAAAGLSAVLD